MSSEQVRAGPPGSRVPGARRAGAARTAPSGNLYSSTSPASSVFLLFPSQPLDLVVVVTTGHNNLGMSQLWKLALQRPQLHSGSVWVAGGWAGRHCGRGLSLPSRRHRLAVCQAFPPQAVLESAIQVRLALNSQHPPSPAPVLRLQATRGSHLVLWCVIKKCNLQ